MKGAMVSDQVKENTSKSPWPALPQIPQQVRPAQAYLSVEARQKMVKCFLIHKTQEENTADKRYHNTERKLRKLKKIIKTCFS